MLQVNKIEVINLEKSYRTETGRFPVLRGVNFTVKDGEFVTIVGPNGCGKSTLFHLISGIENSDSGRILFGNKLLQDRRGHCGYMFQNHLLFPWRSALENIMLSYELKGMNMTHARCEAGKLLKRFGLSQYEHFHPAALSGSMKQRVSLLRTIAFNSELLLLDEPFGSCDYLTRYDLHDYLLSVWKKLKLTIIFITHDIKEAIKLSDRILVMGEKPSGIIRNISVDLARPRDLRIMSTPGAVRLEKQLLKILLGEKQ